MARKRFTTAFKDESCKLVMEQGYEIAEAARQTGGCSRMKSPMGLRMSK